MSSNKKWNFRPLAAALGSALIPIGLFGIPDFTSLTPISIIMTALSVGASTSAVYLKVLERRPWIAYAAATVLTVWAILGTLAVYAVAKSSPEWSDFYTVPTLAALGSLAAWRQIAIAIATFVVADLAIARISPRSA